MSKKLSKKEKGELLGLAGFILAMVERGESMPYILGNVGHDIGGLLDRPRMFVPRTARYAIYALGTKAHYLVHVHGDVDPDVVAGPFEREDQLLPAVRRHIKTDDADPEGGYYSLTINEKGIPSMDTFTGDEIEQAREAAMELQS